VALVGQSWLSAQLRTDRVGRLDLTSDDRDGLTVVHAGAVSDAVKTEARGIRGVAGASAHWRGQPTHRLVLGVDLTDYADIAEVHTRLEDGVVAHVRQALDDPALRVDIELRPGKARSAARALA
jgi:hypothetical protein